MSSDEEDVSNSYSADSEEIRLKENKKQEVGQK